MIRGAESVPAGFGPRVVSTLRVDAGEAAGETGEIEPQSNLKGITVGHEGNIWFTASTVLGE